MVMQDSAQISRSVEDAAKRWLAKNLNVHTLDKAQRHALKIAAYLKDPRLDMDPRFREAVVNIKLPEIRKMIIRCAEHAKAMAAAIRDSLLLLRPVIERARQLLDDTISVGYSREPVLDSRRCMEWRRHEGNRRARIMAERSAEAASKVCNKPSAARHLL